MTDGFLIAIPVINCHHSLTWPTIFNKALSSPSWSIFFFCLPWWQPPLVLLLSHWWLPLISFVSSSPCSQPYQFRILQGFRICSSPLSDYMHFLGDFIQCYGFKYCLCVDNPLISISSTDLSLEVQTIYPISGSLFPCGSLIKHINLVYSTPTPDFFFLLPKSPPPPSSCSPPDLVEDNSRY